MERNLRLYPYYQAARSLTFWLPVFFLYFSAELPVHEVLELEAIYYGGVVLLEVPSGYLSDRLGRRPTLLVSTSAWALGYVALTVGGSFSVFAGGQLLLAAGMAFNSGTDGALLFDSLLAEGQQEALAEHEGKAQAWGLLAMGGAALVGGLVAAVDLRLGHGLSAIGAVAAWALVLAMREPPHSQRAAAPWQQLRSVLDHIRRPGLGWVFGFAVAMTVFNHVPYELAQPYLALVLGEARGATATPVVSGVVMALMMVVAAGGSRLSPTLARRLGTGPLLLGAMALQGVVIASLAIWLHPLVLGVLLLRSAPGSLAGPVQLQFVLPRVEGHLRATYLSVQSLAGRLAFSGVLLLGARSVGGLEALDHAAIRSLATGTGLLMVVVAVVLLARVRSVEAS